MAKNPSDDNEVRSNLPAVSNTRKGPPRRLGPAKVTAENRARKSNDDLAPRSNLPKEQYKFAKGGSVRGNGCATKGKGRAC